MGFIHVPVLIKEVIEYLNCQAAVCQTVAWYLDGTLGGGGHSEAILKASVSSGKVLGIDYDEAAIAQTAKRLAQFEDRVILVHDSFKNIKAILKQEGIDTLAGAILDLGLSSRQIEDGQRGFSFKLEGPLDMRQDQRQTETAADLINRLPHAELRRLIGTYGEERWSNRIAGAIVRSRENKAIKTTLDLAEIVSWAIPKAHHPRRIHPATKTFQALRIAVNQELTELDTAIKDILDALAVGGRLCVISYHSLEDIIVKQTFKQLSGVCSCPHEIPVCVCGRKAVVKQLTTKPVVPTEAEQQPNPRARSAKLRVAQRLPMAA